MSVELNDVKISVGHLEIGMYVTRLDRPWEETDFLLQGFLITTQTEIDALLDVCKYVYIEERRSLDGSYQRADSSDRRVENEGLAARLKKKLTNKHVTPPKKRQKDDPENFLNNVSYINKVPIEQEFENANQCFKFAKLTAQSIMDGIRIGRLVEIKTVREAVDNVVKSILNNRNALMWLTKIKNKDDYTAEHCMNVCILSVTFARHLGMPESQLQKIGIAALLHDVGKAKIPDEILNKPGRFTDDEMEVMKMHTTFGRDLLLSNTTIGSSAIDVAYCHHERIDGLGYPRGLIEHQIPFYSKLIAITDTYDAITSSRVYDNARASKEALDIIYKDRGRQFDENLALEFIKCIGIYPPGSIVELTDGRVGVVIATNTEQKLRPKVLIVRDAEKQPCKQKIFDLFKNLSEEPEKIVHIAQEHPNGRYGIDLKALIERGLVLKK